MIHKKNYVSGVVGWGLVARGDVWYIIFCQRIVGGKRKKWTTIAMS